MEHYLAKTFLIGINFYDVNKNLIEQYQTHGIAEQISGLNIIIRRPDNSVLSIPFDERAIQTARPGTYRERSTGNEIENPDYIAQWAVENISEIENVEKYKAVGFEASG